MVTYLYTNKYIDHDGLEGGPDLLLQVHIKKTCDTIGGKAPVQERDPDTIVQAKLLANAKMYALGEIYQISSLKSRAVTELRAVKKSSPRCTDHLAIVDTVFTSTPDSDERLRSDRMYSCRNTSDVSCLSSRLSKLGHLEFTASAMTENQLFQILSCLEAITSLHYDCPELNRLWTGPESFHDLKRFCHTIIFYGVISLQFLSLRSKLSYGGMPSLQGMKKIRSHSSLTSGTSDCKEQYSTDRYP